MTQKLGSPVKARRARQSTNMGFIVGVLVVGMAACAKDIDEWRLDQISSNDKAKSASKLNERESTIVSFAATRILKHSAQAKKAITDKKFVHAQERVDTGLKLVSIIENVLPPTSVETESKSRDLAYQDKEVLSRNMRFPVLEFLLRNDTLAADAQVEAARQKGEKSASTLVQPKSQPQARVKEKAKDPAGNRGDVVAANDDDIYTVRDVEYVDETVELDVTFAKRQLKLAATQLIGNKPKEAEKALDAIKAEGLSVDIVLLDAPLEAVADNLAFAEYEISHGRVREAKLALKTASEELQRYAENTDDNKSEEFKKMREEIDELAKEIHEKMLLNETLVNAHQKIANWWNRTWQWITRSDA